MKARVSVKKDGKLSSKEFLGSEDNLKKFLEAFKKDNYQIAIVSTNTNNGLSFSLSKLLNTNFVNASVDKIKIK